MEESYFVWNNKSSKDFGIVCEYIAVSQPEQKLKITNLTNKDGDYNYTSMNEKGRSFFEDRVITISSYFKFKDMSDRAAKLSKISNWLYSFNYNENNILEILPDFNNVYWENVKLRGINTIDNASMHTVKVIFQFSTAPFSLDKSIQTLDAGLVEFTSGKHFVKITNAGFFTDDFVITLTGACNYADIEKSDLMTSKLSYINILDGFTESCVIDFKNKKVVVDGVDSTKDVEEFFDFFELAPGDNYLLMSSDANFSVKLDIYNKYLFSYSSLEKDTIEVIPFNEEG